MNSVDVVHGQNKPVSLKITPDVFASVSPGRFKYVYFAFCPTTRHPFDSSISNAVCVSRNSPHGVFELISDFNLRSWAIVTTRGALDVNRAQRNKISRSAGVIR